MKTEKRRGPGIVIYLLIIALFVAGALFFSRCASTGDSVTYSQYLSYMEDGSMLEALVQQNREIPTGRIVFKLKNSDDTYAVYVTDVNKEMASLEEHEIMVRVSDVPGEDYFLHTILPIILLALVIVMAISLFIGRVGGKGGDGNPMSGFTKNRARKTDSKNNKTRFKDVAGLHEEKEELQEVVDFLRDPDKYMRLGARIPKGVLLLGPPGTGKTLLAKAVAGEAGVPFFTISGSDFVEMFVGVGASRVRDLFENAKQNAPCIIFIDEIDAVARIRGSGMGGGHDEREQTLNQLLVEMDGFTINQGIIVMAATNRADILDPAILRPGRFDRKVTVGRPDVRGREEILRVHAENKPLSDDVDLKRVAKTTAGFSGADLENLLNEAAISAAKENRPYITQKDIEESFVKVGIGQEKKSKLISEKEKKITAFHEMGHAILFHILPDVGPVHTISIIPTGQGAAGYTMPLPENDEMFNTRGKMIQNIMVSMGGRIAEELVLTDITTGASQDIRQATDIARAMVMKYGMSEKLGFINYEQQQDEVFLGRDLGHVKTYGSDVYNVIEAEVQEILKTCYDDAKKIVMEHEDILYRGADLLLEKEKIGQKEFEALFEKRKFAWEEE